MFNLITHKINAEYSDYLYETNGSAPFTYHKWQRIETFSKEASPFNTHNPFYLCLKKKIYVL